ncbi:hypothetical protein Tco_1107179 [Tanacetum coccineum]
MASLDYRFNLIKECSSCGALYTKSCGCSKGGFVDKFVLDHNKTPDSSQRPFIFEKNCPECGDPVEGLYCRQCALIRKKLEEVFQDFQDTSESSNDNPNVVNVPQEPFVLNQDPGKNPSQSPPHIDHNCCYECGDSLDGIVCQRCTCESCGKGVHYGYNCPPKVSIISNLEPCFNQNVDELPQTLPSFHPTCYSGNENSFTYDSNLNLVVDSPNVFNPPSQLPTYSCEFCGNDAHYGYDCPPQVPFIYNPKPCYNQDFNFPQNFQSFQQQYICCTNCGGPHETFQCHQVIFYKPCCENYGGPHATFECQPMNQNFYDHNSSGFEQFQPSQSVIDHLNFQQNMNDSMIELRETFQAWLQQRQEQVVNPDSYTPEPSDIIISGLPPCIEITPVLTTKEPVDSLIMKDEHLDTIPATKFNEFIKSSAENLVPTLSESEDASDGVCDFPVCDDFPKSHLVTFSNPLFDIDDDCTSSDDESFSEEDVPMENFKFISNSLFDLDEEIVSTELNLIQNEVLESITSIPPRIDSFYAESNLIESLLNRNISIDSSSKIDSLLDEFACELTLLKSIPPRINDYNLDPEGEIHLIERLLYENASPLPPEELYVENSIKSFSPSPIPVEDSDSLMEEIDVFLASDGSIPPGIESDDYDLEGDDNSTSFPELESFHNVMIILI